MKIKICGITRIEETKYLNCNHVDFAGFVLFFPKSKRNISISRAKELIHHLNPEIQKVAVCVTPKPDEVHQIEDAGFDYIQIHGELSEELLKQIQIPILKAFNVNDMSHYEYYHNCPQIAGYVFDAQEPGSGKTFDWNLVKSVPRDEKLLLLAGGLNADNVSEAIAAVHPDGVDVSSGVESATRPGKDGKMVDQFVTTVRSSTL